MVTKRNLVQALNTAAEIRVSSNTTLDLRNLLFSQRNQLSGDNQSNTQSRDVIPIVSLLTEDEEELGVQDDERHEEDYFDFGFGEQFQGINYLSTTLNIYLLMLILIRYFR